MTDLVRYDAMCRAIAEAYEVDEVKEIRDRAVALEAYFRQAKDPEPERRACEIRIRAEKRAGVLLAQMEKNKGRLKRGKDFPPCPEGSTVPTLAEMGISEKQSSRWQQLASVPDDQFEQALSTPEKPSTSSIINGAKPTRDPMDDGALWLWGRLEEFERRGLLDRDQKEVLSHMTEAMRASTIRLSKLVADWLNGGFDD